MIPLRLVIDTNVVVSAALKPEGPQRTIVLLAMTKPARWYCPNRLCQSTQRFLLALSSRSAGVCANNCCN